MSLRGTRGTEKPIEIFIALFIILAVAMLLLRLFKDQIDQKVTLMQREEWKEERERQKENAIRTCDKSCTDAVKAKCSERALANFCKEKVVGGLDLNLNQNKDDYVAGVDVEGFMLSGGTCEDRIYCREITECNACDVELNIDNCVKITCTWLKKSVPAATALARAQQIFRFGDCLDPPAKAAAIGAKETWDWNLQSYITTYCS